MKMRTINKIWKPRYTFPRYTTEGWHNHKGGKGKKEGGSKIPRMLHKPIRKHQDRTREESKCSNGDNEKDGHILATCKLSSKI